MSNIFSDLLYLEPESPDQAADIEIYKAFESCLRTADQLIVNDEREITSEEIISIASAMLNYKGQLKQVKMLEEIKERLNEIDKSIVSFEPSAHLGNISDSIDAACASISQAIESH